MQVNQLSQSVSQLFFPLQAVRKAQGASGAEDPARLQRTSDVRDSVSISPAALDAARALENGAREAKVEGELLTTIPLGSERELTVSRVRDEAANVPERELRLPGQKGLEADESAERAGGSRELSPEENARVAELAQRDREVRSHEAAHVSAGGSVVAGGPTFTYTTGPDGKRYAVGGEVPVRSSSNSNDPARQAQEAQQVIRAALAPADPSGADLAIAAQAAQALAQARADSRNSEGEDTNNVERSALDPTRQASTEEPVSQLGETGDETVAGASEGAPRSGPLSASSSTEEPTPSGAEARVESNAAAASSTNEPARAERLESNPAIASAPTPVYGPDARQAAGGIFGFAQPDGQSGGRLNVLA